MSEDNYSKRGVSSSKEDVHKAIQNSDKGIFPNAFCKILPDVFGRNRGFCNLMHIDGAGSKAALAYIYWKETGDLSVWKDIIQDSIVMNLDDIICVGGVNSPILLSSGIGRNKYMIPGEVISAIINGAEEFIKQMRSFGIEIYGTGGETADLGDQIRTIVIDHTMSCRMKRADVININIQPGDLIVAYAAFGQASYETAYNGGMGSNGLTGARHDIFHKEYITKYPESFDPILLKECPELVYKGAFKVTDVIPAKYFANHAYAAPLNVGKLVLGPTRTFAPVVKEGMNIINKNALHGIIHCTGGAQTKVMKFVEAENVHIIKDNLFPIPPLFEMITEMGAYHADERKQMYKTFNMGHRLEWYIKDEKTAQQIIETANSFNIEARIVGHVEKTNGKSKLTIKDDYGTFVY